jgi:hypothetical protein
MMLVEPAVSALASPLLLMVAIAGAEELHVVINELMTWVVASESVAVAVNC